MHEALQPNPPRLTLEESELALSLRAAESEYCGGIREAEAFERVERTRLRRKVASMALAASAAVAALTVGEQTLGSHLYATEPTIRSESLGPRVKTDLRRAPDAPKDVAVLTGREIVVLPAKDITVRSGNETARRAPLPARERSANSANPANPGNSANPGNPANPGNSANLANPALCRELASEQNTEEAIRCFGTLAQGSGIDAEVASYEAARVSAQNSGDPVRTLRLLDEHERRFSRGVMRAEASWLRIVALQRAGRLDETLAHSEALLAAPEGRPFAGQLHLLRGRVYEESRNDCANAVSEFVALSGEPGPGGEEAEWRRARCLKALGRTAEAIGAYERYLARSDALHAHEARQQLATLLR